MSKDMSKNILPRNQVLSMIARSSVYGNLGLFIGAGMSKAILNSPWNTVALSWKELIFKCAEQFGIDLINEIGIEGSSYPDISSRLAKKISLTKNISYHEAIVELKQKIADITCWYPNQQQRDEYGPILKGLLPNWIITTNYDLILETLLTGQCISLTPDEQMISPKGLVPIYHLHGIRSNPNSIILLQEDYISLFRPNQYRQQKLSLSLKESTTLMIGYGLGDINVLTAVDWISNVYGNQRITHPHGLIQLLHKDEPVDKPYIDHNGITILEFDDLKEVLEEIIGFVKVEEKSEAVYNKDVENYNEYLTNPDESEIDKLIDDHEVRRGVIHAVSQNGTKLISGFMELFTKMMDRAWLRTQPYNAFNAYGDFLTILIDVLVTVPLEKLHPALLESIVYNLNRVAYYVGDIIGKSRKAHSVWMSRKGKIPLNTLSEIGKIAEIKGYESLTRILRR